MAQFTKILFWVVCLLLHITLRGQALVVDPASIQVEETASNWQTALLDGFKLFGSYGFATYKVEIPKLEVGLPIQLGEAHEHEWILKRTAQNTIAWAADKTAYTCGQRYIQDRSYYARYGEVIKDFRMYFQRYLSFRIPGSRVGSIGSQTPKIPTSTIQFKRIPYSTYLLHIGIGK